MRIGRVIDGKLRGSDPRSVERRDRIVNLLRDLAAEVHATGSIRDHADPNDHSGWNVHGIETCEDLLCVDALAAIKDIEEVVIHFPMQ